MADIFHLISGAMAHVGLLVFIIAMLVLILMPSAEKNYENNSNQSRQNNANEEKWRRMLYATDAKWRRMMYVMHLRQAVQPPVQVNIVTPDALAQSKAASASLEHNPENNPLGNNQRDSRKTRAITHPNLAGRKKFLLPRRHLSLPRPRVAATAQFEDTY